MKTTWIAALGLTLAASLLPRQVPGADVSFYGMLKTQSYLQTNSSATVLQASNACSFTAFVVTTNSSSVTNATITPSGKPTRTLLPDPGAFSLRYDYTTNTQSQLDSLFPASVLFSPANYTMSMTTAHDGTQSATITWPNLFGAPASFPTALRVTNYNQCQTIDQTLDFTLHWPAPGGGILATSVLIQVLIFDISSNLVFSSPFPFTPGALDGNASSIVIPANQLPAGTNLQGHLTVAQVGIPNTTAYPGALGIAALTADTAFPLSTRPTPTKPALSLLARDLDGAYRVRLNGESNRTYQVQATAAFDGWTNLLTTNSVSGSFDFKDPASTNAIQRFYRGKVGQ
jgi:hypothetical protein